MYLTTDENLWHPQSIYVFQRKSRTYIINIEIKHDSYLKVV